MIVDNLIEISDSNLDWYPAMKIKIESIVAENDLISAEWVQQSGAQS